MRPLSFYSANPASFAALSKPSKFEKIGPLSAVVLLHAGFFYMMLGANSPNTVQASPQPREIFASFITPEPVPAPEVPKPVSVPKPKTVPVVKKTPTRPKPVKPKITAPPTEQSISVPAEAPPSFEQPVAAAPSAPVAPQMPVAAAPAQPKTISGVEYIQAPQPVYPPVARRMGEEGKVVLRVLVNERGRPERVDVQKSSGSQRLDEAAQQAALRAQFKPHLEDGRPVAVYALVPINFSIQ